LGGISDTAGLCIDQQGGEDEEERSATCWRAENGEIQYQLPYDDLNSYLIKPSEFTEETTIGDFDRLRDLEVKEVPGLFGNWLCTPSLLVMQSVSKTCMRFLPT
jgi:hypothetical protein